MSRGDSIIGLESVSVPPSQCRTYEDALTKSSMKRSVVIGGHKTSVSLENEFWSQLKGIADARRLTVSKLIAQIDEGRDCRNLSSAIRVYVLAHSHDFANTA